MKKIILFLFVSLALYGCGKYVDGENYDCGWGGCLVKERNEPYFNGCFFGCTVEHMKTLPWIVIFIKPEKQMIKRCEGLGFPEGTRHCSFALKDPNDRGYCIMNLSNTYTEDEGWHEYVHCEDFVDFKMDRSPERVFDWETWWNYGNPGAPGSGGYRY